MKRIKAILFDKDGTLIHFQSIWIKATKQTAEDIIQRLALPTETKSVMYRQLCESIGLSLLDEIEGNGILAGGTIKDIARAWKCILDEHALDSSIFVPSFDEWISTQMYEMTKYYSKEIKGVIPNIATVLLKLSQKDILLGIATSDEYMSTELCLERLGIKEYFSSIITADNFSAQKPDPSIVLSFCRRFHLKPEEIAIVGDTIVDMKLGKNANVGLTIGVLSGVSSSYQLLPYADMLLPSIEQLIRDDGTFIWENSVVEERVN